ncbi:hypothetical protein ACFQRC_02855 [Enterovirga sp. GCM10030262]|uniref:hypothetical protein n=1 Tax=Enterovirga sp. GCM10030262 TaxID=3273391 RepID=UPI0036128E25
MGDDRKSEREPARIEGDGPGTQRYGHLSGDPASPGRYYGSPQYVGVGAGDGVVITGVDPDPAALGLDGERQIRIRVETDGPLGVGNVGRFLQEVDDALRQAAGTEAARPELAHIGTGSLIVVVTVGGAVAVAKLALETFKYFDTRRIEKKRRNEDIAREEQHRREDREERDRRRREEREWEEKKAAAKLDRHVTNVIFYGGGARYELRPPR